ncbi:MAG: CD225/dispanin family protein [Alistipes senegalensis]|nr:CD225/dispanin family protein [Bacteroides cellulosilyticus]MCM1352164.1 CD225/dispanin family protein [Alistipes senegalensis]
MEEITPPRKKPENCLVWAILSTVLCCLPFGIVSIVYASKVDSEWMVGHFDEAEDAAKKARTWAIVSAASALFFWVIYIVVIVGLAFFVASETC